MQGVFFNWCCNVVLVCSICLVFTLFLGSGEGQRRPIEPFLQLELYPPISYLVGWGKNLTC